MTQKAKAEIIKVERGSEAQTPMALIAQAIQNNIPVETMEKLMDLQDRWEAKKAKHAYDAAMAAFQSECPVIKKTKPAKDNAGKVLYKFAPIEEIDAQTKELRMKHGFSHSFKTLTTEGKITAICIVKHTEGHSEESDFTVPSTGGTSIMSGPQKEAAALTFAKRYAFCNAFGIMTGDEDNDAKKEAKEPTTVDKVEQYRSKLEGCRHIEELKKVWAEMPIQYKKETSLVSLCAKLNKELSV